MKIAHLIFAHSNPDQVFRLAKRLEHPDSYIFVHLDAKVEMSSFTNLLAVDRLRFIKNRVHCRWAGYSLVQGELNSFKEILDFDECFDYVNLLSGSDYPIKPLTHIHAFFEQNPDRIFMAYEEIGSQWKQQEWRVQKYYLDELSIGGRLLPGRRLLQKTLNAVLPRRKPPMAIYGRSQWFTVAPRFLRFVIDRIEENKELISYFKYTWAPDEFFFQTLLYNSEFRSYMVNDNLRYIQMTSNGMGEHPEIITSKDIDVIVSSNKLYARKFDAISSDEILKFIDRQYYECDIQ